MLQYVPINSTFYSIFYYPNFQFHCQQIIDFPIKVVDKPIQVGDMDSSIARIGYLFDKKGKFKFDNTS